MINYKKGIKLYFFQKIFPTKYRNYYIQSKEIAEEFVLNIKKRIGYLNFFDYYEKLDNIGEGKFCLFILGVQKLTKERVRIKIIQK